MSKDARVLDVDEEDEKGGAFERFFFDPSTPTNLVSIFAVMFSRNGSFRREESRTSRELDDIQAKVMI
jgi:hypothetical protein